MYSDLNELLSLHIDNPNQKRKKEYGLKLAKGIFESADRGSDGYYGKRYRNWTACREFSKGTNNTKEFMSYMKIEGNQSFINIDWTPVKILPKFVEILLGGFMSRKEKPIVKATDDMSSHIKELEKQEAKYRMLHKDEIKQIEEQIGHKIESHKFIPEDEDDMALFFDMEYRLPEEILFEEKLSKILDDNDYPVLKRSLIRDIIDLNFSITKTYFDTNGKIKIKRCKPENIIYNVFESDNGKDISYLGEVTPMTISSIRKKYNIEEEKLFELARKSSRELKRSENLYWRESYKYTELRPYDDYSVLVFDFEVKTIDIEYSVKTENQFGNTLVVPKAGKPIGTTGDIIESKKMNIYHGVWVTDTDIMLEWGLNENIIRPYQNGVDAFFSYSVICPNADGSLIPSMIDKAITPVRQMILIRLKMQQLISTMRPDGFSVDIAGLRDVDLGLGDSVSPLQLMRVYDQTGRVYWDSTGDDGQPKQSPITPIASNANVAQLNTLIAQYNFELDRLREEMGISEYRDSASVPVKTGLGVMQNQIQSSNNATEYIYDAFSTLMEDTLQKVSMMVWDTVVFKASREKEFEGIDTRLIDMTFDVKVNMLSDERERAEMQQMLNTALESGLLTYEQAFKIKRIEDVKLAELYLSKSMKRIQKEQQEQAQRNAEMNAKIQQQSSQQKMQEDAQLKQLDAQGKMAINDSKAKGDKDIALLNFVSSMYGEAFKMGKELPDDIKPLAQLVLGDIVNDKQKEIQAKEEQEKQQEMQKNIAENQAAMQVSNDPRMQQEVQQ